MHSDSLAATAAGPTRASARARRLQILEAALRVMARDGLRAVTHRGVAAEAGVPLSATTYYFRDLDDLLAESFLHWSRGQQALMDAFQAAASQRVAALREHSAAPAEIAAAVARIAAAYVVDQVRRQRDDRVLEFAFLHEAVRNPRLGTVVGAHLQGQLGFLERFHAGLGSTQPAVDAQLAHGLLLGLEKAALLGASPSDEEERIRGALDLHLRRALGPGDGPGL
jgi:DNA-binding transcriptional regulator YbjK